MTGIDEKRIKVLKYSLHLEKIASYLLAIIFDIENVKDTKSFGNTATSLSFNQKLHLLMDFGAVESKDKATFDAVMNIRNQFMHNADCNSFEDAIKPISGMLNRFKKIYPECFQDDDIEESIEKCVRRSFGECINIARLLKGGFERKIFLKNEHIVNKAMVESLFDVGKELFENLTVEILNNKFDFANKILLVEKLKSLENDIFAIALENAKKAIRESN